MYSKFSPLKHLFLTISCLLIGAFLTKNMPSNWWHLFIILSFASIILSVYYYLEMIKGRFSFSIIIANLFLIPLYFLFNIFMEIPMLFYDLFCLIRSIPSTLEEKEDKTKIKEYLKIKKPSGIKEDDLLNCYCTYIQTLAKKCLYNEPNMHTIIEALDSAEHKEIANRNHNDEVMTYYNLTNDCLATIQKYYTHNGLLKK